MFFSYLTNLTNTLIAVAALRLAWRFDGLFARPRVAGALPVYASVVMAVYELALRHLWHPRGLVFVTDMVFHDVVPLLTIALWILFLRRGTLRWRDAAYWLIGPATYGIWVAVLGGISGNVPYPFLNLPEIGIGRLLLNVTGLAAIFWLVGLAFVGVDRLLPIANTTDNLPS